MIETELKLSDVAEKIKTSPKCVVKFFAKWCGTCGILASNVWPRLIADNLDVDFFECDADVNPQLSGDHKVLGLPTVIFFKDGKEIDRIKGLVRQSDYQAKIEGLK